VLIEAGDRGRRVQRPFADDQGGPLRCRALESEAETIRDRVGEQASGRRGSERCRDHADP
jgi:hypothetical protein